MGDIKFVFISHSNMEPDCQITKRLVKYLESKKFGVWYDGMLSGKKWPGEIYEHLKAASAYVLVESERSLSSPEVVNEMGLISDEVKKRGKYFSPLFVDLSFFENPSRFDSDLGYYFGCRDDQGVDMAKFANEEEAFKKLADYLSPVIDVGVNNFSDFELANDMELLVRYKGNDGVVYIPQCVKVIAPQAFKFNKTLSRVDIPDTVEEIGSKAFCGCTKLTSVTGMKNIKSCGRRAFDETGIVFEDESCTMINGVVTGGKQEVKILVIPEGAKVIANGAFECCTAESIVLSQGLKHIGSRAFADCCRIKEIVLPESLESLGEMAFGGCINLKEVKLQGRRPDGYDGAFKL